MPAARKDEYPASTIKIEEKASPSARTHGKYICLGIMTQQLPTAAGYLDGHPVTELRDSGSNTLVVRRSLVPERNFTGNMRTVYLLDGSSKQLPEAKVYVDSPFFRGTTLALCMEKPLYDVLLGNINRVLYPTGSDMSRDPSDVSRLHKESAPAEEPVRHHSLREEEANGCTSTAARWVCAICAVDHHHHHGGTRRDLAVFEPGGQQFRAPGVNEARGPARRDVRGKVRRIVEPSVDEGVRGTGAPAASARDAG
ncbi:hypothetical protein HPB49_017264 [Dermacentor silvarum]|uniref:Uncharacterized protein n=1 Tax=Dermacentor silvarum TaxID=543639 RepID=A0ACB8E101_DERSI|nr:hypothetical protein HPB49_017264 [Dermacentor silvarum]